MDPQYEEKSPQQQAHRYNTLFHTWLNTESQLNVPDPQKMMGFD